MPTKRTTTKKSKPRARGKVSSRVDYLRAKMSELEEFLDSDSGKRNGAAYVAGVRLCTTLRGELEELLKPADAPVEKPVAQTPAQLRAALLAAVRSLPDAVLVELEEAIAARRSGRPTLRVVERG